MEEGHNNASVIPAKTAGMADEEASWKDEG